jgi:hypothetical protein
MPFCDTEHVSNKQKRKITKSQWDHIYQKWIKRAVESYKAEKIVCKRSLAKPGSFIKGIVVDLASSDLVIADLTGARPNVYYELGIRHALSIGTIIITQDFAALPSDLANYFVFSYDYSDKDFEYEEYYPRFEKKMHETLQFWNDAEDPCDSPVSDFLGIKNQLLEKDLDQEKEIMLRVLTRLKKHLAHNFSICETLSEIMGGKEFDSLKQIMAVDVFPIDMLYSQLIGHNWKILKGIGFESLEDIIVHHRRLFHEISLTCEKLETNSNKNLAPDYLSYLKNLLAAAADAEKRFKNEFDLLIEAVGEIKLQKRGAARNLKP